MSVFSSQAPIAEPVAGTRPGRLASLCPELAALLLFVALTAFHTWPLASAPGTWCRNDNGDTVLNEWAVAWVAHQVVTDPVNLFDANIFYPERRTLAFSEHLLPQALMVAPVNWAGGSPVLAHNLALLAGFVLTGWAMSHVVRLWTGSWGAGLVAGSLAAFNAHSLTRLGHLQAQHVEFLPFALLALDNLLRSPRVRHAVSLAAAFALQALTSGYFLLFTAVAMVSAAAARPAEWVGRRFRQVAPQVALAASLAGLALLPFLVPYWQVRKEQGLVRTLGEVERYSAVWTDYLATGALVHWTWWSERFFRGDALFPGVIAIAMIATALVTKVAFTDRRARMAVAVAAVAMCLSFGVHFPLYPFLFRTVPLFEGVRAVIRFGQFALVALAVVAGFGAAWWLGRVRGGGWRWVAAALLVIVVNLEAWRGPLFYVKFEGLPRIFRTLAFAPGAVVAYLPFWGGIDAHVNARYMLGSTLNWRPMLNGYSGFMPRSFHRSVTALRAFPEPDTISYLQRAGVTFVVVDTANMSAHRMELLDQATNLRLWVSDGVYRIYQVR